MLKYFKAIVLGFVSLVKGMIVTLRHAFRKPITVAYPEQKPELSQRFRGRLVLPVDPEKGEHRCTACMICVKTCPNRSIEVEKMVGEDGKPKPRAARYLYDIGRCMYCNLCVESCPFAAIVMSDEYELSVLDKSSLVRDLIPERHRITGRKTKWWVSKFKEES
jgi:NADH-quinone oxidoreductase subunit I